MTAAALVNIGSNGVDLLLNLWALRPVELSSHQDDPTGLQHGV
jgi:hypothetical protein